ncbi:MAG: methionine biosynthesis protein MetW [Ardenticatenaceae bacterium]|nr:methionine biosynthesis protein MetW [Ardenticatenaceae bacterium]
MILRSDLQVIAEMVPEQARVLDLGCGDGDLLDFLVRQKRVKGSGIEISEAGVMACVRRGLSVRQGYLQEGLADYPDGLLDVVVLSQTLPFLSRPGEVLQEMLRVGQQAVVSFPNWGYWRCRLEYLVNGRVPQAPDFEQRWDDDRRWQWFTVADFEDLCRTLGVTIENKVFLSGNWRIDWGENWRSRTAVYRLRI